MWTLTATARTRATASRVWAIYGDVANWPRWDHGMAPWRLVLLAHYSLWGDQSCPLRSPTSKKGIALMIVLPLDQTMPSSSSCSANGL